MSYVYVIKSRKSDFTCIGSTNNLKRRIVEHNEHTVSSTKSRAPFDIVYYEAYLHEDDARKRESMLKLRGQARNQLMKRITNSMCRTDISGEEKVK